MAVLRRNNGTQIATVAEVTNQRIVHNGDGNPTSAGSKKFDDVTLVASKDSAYLAASSPTPLLLGISHISFLPTRYPET